MTECKLNELEEYNSDKLVRKLVRAGSRSTVALLHLLPGQKVPKHSQAGVEICAAGAFIGHNNNGIRTC